MTGTPKKTKLTLLLAQKLKLLTPLKTVFADRCGHGLPATTLKVDSFRQRALPDRKAIECTLRFTTTMEEDSFQLFCAKDQLYVTCGKSVL